MMLTNKAGAVFLPRLQGHTLITAVLGSLLIALAAQISLPLQPVPITLQTFAVFALAFLTGRRRATLAIALYLFEGALGLPVFAGGQGGALYLFGPTAGYLWGFLPAAWLCGFAMETGLANRRIAIAAVITLASLVIFALGFSVLSFFIGATAAWTVGVAPFVGVFFVKLVILTALAPYAWRKA